MKVEQLKVDPTKARQVWRKYQEHVAYQRPYDVEIAAIYKRLAQGKTVIRALESISTAGLNAEGFPRLAICPAHMTECYWHRNNDSCIFGARRFHSRARSDVVRMNWPGIKHSWQTPIAQVPLVPVHLRPKRGLQNYHILWEAEWTKVYPRDPYLLRRFGGDAWLVVAAWDLTDVERAVMANRISA
jgi:hypothetical protein